MAMAVPNLLGRQETANIDVTQGSIAGIEQAIQMYQLDHQGALPNNRDGLKSLVEKSNQRDRKWRGPYLTKLPVDAWGTPFEYTSPGRKSKHAYEIVSAGPDLTHGTDDDLGNWTE